MSGRTLSLLAEFHQSGDHEAAWRLPSAEPDRIHDYAYYRDLARVAERGLFDSLFFADFHAFRPGFRDQMPWGFEPTSLLAAVAAACPEVGIIATASTVYSQPDTLARTYATLHEQTGGRVGWNIVTAGREAAAASYGLAANPPHAERYRQARGFTDEVLSLWEKDPWGLGVSAAVRPVLVQAGSSEDGRDFAGRFAELVFTATPDIASARAFRADVRKRATAYGRDPASLNVSPGFLVVLGSTEEEARRRRDELDDLLTEANYRTMLGNFGIDPSVDLDAPAGRLDKVVGDGLKSRIPVLEQVIASHPTTPSWRQLIRGIAGSRGHLHCTGTPEQVVDIMEEWYRGEAADAFVVKFSHNPGGVQDFVEQVVPELQRRGLYRREYGEDRTLAQRLAH